MKIRLRAVGRLLPNLVALIVAASAAAAAPTITGLNRPDGPLGSYVILYGSGFGDTQGTGYVLLSDRVVPVLVWSSAAVTVNLTPRLNGVSLTLDVQHPLTLVKGGEKSNSVPFLLTAGPPPTTPTESVGNPSDAPHIDGLSNSTVKQKGEVTIYGTGFGSTLGANYVVLYVPALNDPSNLLPVLVPVVAWSGSAITVVIDTPSLNLTHYLLVVRQPPYRSSNLVSFIEVP